MWKVLLLEKIYVLSIYGIMGFVWNLYILSIYYIFSIYGKGQNNHFIIN